jgi:ACT domain-containing protein
MHGKAEKAIENASFLRLPLCGAFFCVTIGLWMAIAMQANRPGRTAKEKRIMEKKHTAVVTVIGRDTIGIIKQVTRVLADHQANVLDISQTVLSGLFNMVMIVDISLSQFDALSDAMSELGKEMGLQMRVQRSEIFDAMHRI